MKIIGIHHLKLTVTNLEISKAFYAKLPGFEIVADHPGFVMFFVGKKFYLGLTDHDQKLTSERFSEFNVGMDHVAFELGALADFQEAVIFLEQEKIPHGEIEQLSNGSYILAFRDPDNIQLEFCYKSS